MDAPTPRMPDAPTPAMLSLSPLSAVGPFEPHVSHPIQAPDLYVLNYLTQSWPREIFLIRDLGYTEQVSGMISIYSSLVIAQEDGKAWLELRSAELQGHFSEEIARGEGRTPAKWLQQGWSRVVDQGSIHDIWVNEIYPGQTNVTIKITGVPIFERHTVYRESGMTQHQGSCKQDSQSIKEEDVERIQKKAASESESARNDWNLEDIRGNKSWEALEGLSNGSGSSRVPVVDAPTPRMHWSDYSMSDPEKCERAEDSNEPAGGTVEIGHGDP